MEHAIHLAAKHFVNEIAPSSNVITSKDSVVDDTENDEDGDFEFTTGDTLGKAIALVKQVRHFSTCKDTPNYFSPDSCLSSSLHVLQRVLRASGCASA